jgi:hypothetical protein
MKDEQFEKSMQFFWKTQQEEMNLHKCSFVHLINAWVSLGALEENKCVHAQIIENGYKFNMFVGVAWWTCV